MQQICSSKFCYYSFAQEITPQDRKIIQEVYCPSCKDIKYCSQQCLQQDKYSHQRNCKRMSDSQSVSTTSTVNRKSLDDYDIIKLPNNRTELGKGAYGAVKLVKEKKTQQKFAMKVITKKSIFQYCSVENLKREIKIQKKLSHPHITKLHHYFEDKDNVYLILEYAENGSLFHFLRKKRFFQEKEAFVYFFQTCLGIDYLHKKGILHRDLKPENLLLDNEGNIKLCDFGWSAESTQNRTTFCGTIDYMSPEMLHNQPHDHTLDIWCLGVLLYELVHGEAPFKGNESDKIKNIKAGSPIQFDASKNISKECKDLIQGILKYNPKDRFTMKQIFNHPFMKQMESIYQINIQSYIYDDARNSGNSTSSEKQNISPESQLYTRQEKTKSAIQPSKDVNYDPYIEQYGLQNSKEMDLYNKLEKQMGTNQPQKLYQSNIYDNRSNFRQQGQQQQQGQRQLSQNKYDYKYKQQQQQYYKQPNYIDDDQFRTRVSRVSQRNNQIEQDRRRQKQEQQQEEGFFDKILGAFGCIKRDDKPQDGNMIDRQKK